jgi:polar amino acid transport system substrate-binding protein
VATAPAIDIADKRVILAYLDEPPFGIPRADGPPAGCDVEMALRTLRAIGIAAETRLVAFAEMLAGLAAGDFHIGTPVYMTPERRRSMDFSRPVWSMPDGLLVTAGNPRALTSYEDIARDPDVVLGVVVGQVQETRAHRAGIPPQRIMSLGTQADAVAALLQGRIDAYASAASVHRATLAQLSDARLARVTVGSPRNADDDIWSTHGAYPFARRAAGLRSAFDRCLDSYLGTESHRQLLMSYGFSDTFDGHIAILD